MQRRVQGWLARSPQWVFSLWAMTAAFGAYFCMYGFRKPYTAATWAGQLELFGVSLDTKVVFILAQVIGYCASKFMGIKVVSELTPGRRVLAIMGVITVAHGALLVLPVLPVAHRPWALFVNGLPLGMMWGMVFSFLEGRRVSDLLGAGLCASFIVASGAVKTLGRWLLESGVPEAWMPFAVGAMFWPPMCLFVWMLAQVPPPSAEDEAARCRREPMDAAARRAFLGRFGPGVLLLTLGYVVLSAFREFRDTYAPELWMALGRGDAPELLTLTEVPIALACVGAVALLTLVRDNRRAVVAVHGMMAGGTLLSVGSTWAFQAGLIGDVAWMTVVGLGLYLAYVPFNCVLFDRLMAATRSVGTAGFLIYVSDAFGYSGAVALLMSRNLLDLQVSWLDFFQHAAVWSGLTCAALFSLAAWYLWRHTSPAARGAQGKAA